jgi:hypothetical protein
MASSPRRVGEISVEFEMPKELPEGQRQHFEVIARECPVMQSLNPSLSVVLTFRYP